MDPNVNIAIDELVKGSLSSFLVEHWQIDYNNNLYTLLNK
jgi:hypothetical protein